MTSDIENKEWPDDYPSLKQVNPNNPFTVPDGYFTGLEEQIISGVSLNKLSPVQPFAVPDNYFKQLSSNITGRIALEEKLKAAGQTFTIPQNYFEDMELQIKSRLAVEDALKTGEQNFAVPQNYFEDMQQQITSRIAIEEALKNEQSFTVPQNYFEDMEQQVKSRIIVEEALRTETAFTIPDNYFEKLNEAVLNQTAALGVTKRRGVVRKLFSTAAFKYATAACFTLVVGAAIFIGQSHTASPNHASTFLHKALSDVPDNAIESYLELHMDAGDTRSIMDKTDEQGSINSIGTDELTDYLSNI